MWPANWRWAGVMSAALLLLSVLVLLHAAPLLWRAGETGVLVLLLCVLVALHALVFGLAGRVPGEAEQEETARALEDLGMARDLMDSLDVGLTVTDDRGRFEYVNAAYARMLGRGAAEVLGCSPLDFTLADDHVGLTRAREEREEGLTTSYTSRLVRPDGALLRVRVRGFPRVEDGQTVGSYALIEPVPDSTPGGLDEGGRLFLEGGTPARR